MPGAFKEEGRKEKEKEERFSEEPLRMTGKTLLWSEWRQRISSEIMGLFGRIKGAPALKGVARTFSRVLRGLFKK